jgi:hypothetical protein
MNNIQENLTTIKDTINDLKSTINEIAIVNGSNEVISDCTSFENYPEILRSVSLNASSGIATIFAYKISDIDPGSPGSDGYFDFNTNTYSVPEN